LATQAETEWFLLVVENAGVLENDRIACEVEVSEADVLEEEVTAISFVEVANEVFWGSCQVTCGE
jgi:hypothetical protein